MKIDLHVHTQERSPCGQSPETEQVQAAIAAGLDAIVFTDHRRLAPAATIARLNEAYAPFQVWGGIELTVDGEDLIVLGIRDQRLETAPWTYPDLRAYVRKLGGFLALAHPFRYRPEINLPLDLLPPDAMEVGSCNTPPEALERIVALARYLDLVPLSNSDAHAAESLGRHFNLCDRRPGDERELLAMLREGSLACVVPGTDGKTRTFRRRAQPPA